MSTNRWRVAIVSSMAISFCRVTLASEPSPPDAGAAPEPGAYAGKVRCGDMSVAVQLTVNASGSVTDFEARHSCVDEGAAITWRPNARMALDNGRFSHDDSWGNGVEGYVRGSDASGTFRRGVPRVQCSDNAFHTPCLTWSAARTTPPAAPSDLGSIRITVTGAETPGWMLLLFDDDAEAPPGTAASRSLEHGEVNIVNRLSGGVASARAAAVIRVPPDGNARFPSVAPGAYRVAALRVVEEGAVAATSTWLALERNARAQLRAVRRVGPTGSFDERGTHRQIVVVSERIAVGGGGRAVAITIDIPPARARTAPAIR